MKKEKRMGRPCRLVLVLLALLCVNGVALAKRVGVYCYFSGAGTEVYEDENVHVRLVLTPAGTALLEVRNLTERVLYVDRGNSFSYVNGQSVPLYVPSSNTETHTYAQGIVEHVDDDVKWVKGESHSSSQTIFNQRIQPIAPHGVSVVYAWEMLPRLLRPDMVWTGRPTGWFRYGCLGRFLTSSTTAGYGQQSPAKIYRGKTFTKGDARYYTAEATPLSLMADIQYSFMEPGQRAAYESAVGETPRRARISDYVSSIVIGSYMGVTKGGLLDFRYVPQQSGRPLFAFRSGRARGDVIAEWATVAAIVAAVATAYSEIHTRIEDSNRRFRDI